MSGAGSRAGALPAPRAASPQAMTVAALRGHVHPPDAGAGSDPQQQERRA